MNLHLFYPSPYSANLGAMQEVQESYQEQTSSELATSLINLYAEHLNEETACQYL